MNKASWDRIAESFSDQVREIAFHDIEGVLQKEIDALANPAHSAADLGCGTGSLVPALAHAFGHVHAVDYSAELVEVARERVPDSRVTFSVHNLAGEMPPPIKVDATFSVNVLIDPREHVRKRIAESIAACTRAGGHCVIVAQSFESALHTYQVLVKCREQDGESRRSALGKVERLAGREVSSMVDGIVEFGGEKTKCYMRDELAGFLEEVGFESVRIVRVPYPWEEEIEEAPEGLGAPFPWDWLAVAKRRDD